VNDEPICEYSPLPALIELYQQALTFSPFVQQIEDDTLDDAFASDARSRQYAFSEWSVVLNNS
jgi:hypothetical protein